MPYKDLPHLWATGKDYWFMRYTDCHRMSTYAMHQGTCLHRYYTYSLN